MPFMSDCEIKVTILGHRITFPVPLRRLGNDTFESEAGRIYVTRNGALYLTDCEPETLGSLVIPGGDCWLGNSPSVTLL